MSEACALRVLSGASQGAEVVVVEARTIVIGHDYACDVVLREPDVANCRLSLTRREDGLNSLRVLAGQARVLGSVLPEGAVTVVPDFIPIAVGDGGCCFATGTADAARWREAALLVQQHYAKHQSIAGPAPTGAPVPRLAWLHASALGLFALTLICMAWLSGGVARSVIPIRSKAEQARKLLNDAGFGALRVELSPDGVLDIAGRVATQQDRRRVERLLAPVAPVRADVISDRELANRIADIAKMMTVAIDVHSLGGGRFEAVTAESNEQRRQALVQMIRQDIPAVASFTLRTTSTAADGEPVPAPTVGTALTAAADDAVPAPSAPVDRAAKRVVAVVAGDPAYIVTADGARYFPGSTMPSGQRLVAVNHGEAVFELRGIKSRMRF